MTRRGPGLAGALHLLGASALPSLAYGVFWYARVPRESYPSLAISGREELPLLLHATSGMALLAVGGTLLFWLALVARARLGNSAGAALLATVSFALLLPALSGQHSVLERYRWGLLAATACLCLGAAFVVMQSLSPEEGVLARLLPVRRRRWLFGAAALGCFALLGVATARLELYPALLLFLYWCSLVGLGVVLFDAPPSSRAVQRTTSIAAGGALVLALMALVWVGHAQSFSRVRYVFSRRCIGADGLVRLPVSARAEWLKVSGALWPGSVASGRARPFREPPEPPKNPPHVVWFVIDAMRRDFVLGDGESAEMPHLERLAKGGIRYDRATSPSSGTAQSMLSVLSGLPPRVLGQLEILPPTLPAALGVLGYRSTTAWDLDKLRLSGTFPLLRGKRMADLGFDAQIAPQGESVAARDRAQVEGVLERLRSATTPRFEYVHLMQTHGPFPGEQGPERYREALARADRELGRLLRGLSEAGLEERTLLYVFGDHGEALGEHERYGHNQTLYLEETHVALVVEGPGVEARVEATPMSLMELPALVLERLGVSYELGAWGGRETAFGREGFVLLEYRILDELLVRSLRSGEESYYHYPLDGVLELEAPPGAPARAPTASERARFFELDRQVNAWQEQLLGEVRALPLER